MQSGLLLPACLFLPSQGGSGHDRAQYHIFRMSSRRQIYKAVLQEVGIIIADWWFGALIRQRVTVAEFGQCYVHGHVVYLPSRTGENYHLGTKSAASELGVSLSSTEHTSLYFRKSHIPILQLIHSTSAQVSIPNSRGILCSSFSFCCWLRGYVSGWS
ncbi:hypothetical protein BDV95DRAFT_63059 [Massariosphaeria phaeospora]|uniref:Uncharacterized protein n=1 Tax=Massariosphaeria phaeospora TaxID=100035 RepID=A0A7C8I4A7_9PLEO|nr:hypothetical protein BDV95DRAFT_63059 [Massariosphaeria phaeospora]